MTRYTIPQTGRFGRDHPHAGARALHGREGRRRAGPRFGVSAEIIDLRSANPLNYQPLADSIRKIGKVLLVSDAVERGSVMQTVAAILSRMCFDDLNAPPVVLGFRNWITRAAELEAMFFPQPQWLLDAIHERYQSLGELACRSRLGV